MKYFGLIATPLAIASWVFAVKIAHYAGMTGIPLWRLFRNASPVIKAATNGLVLGLLAAIVLGALHLSKRNDRGPLIGLLFAGVGFGLLATAFGFLNIHIAMVRTNTTNLRIVAPSAAEALIPLSIGLTIAAICGIGIAFGPPKARIRAD